MPPMALIERIHDEERRIGLRDSTSREYCRNIFIFKNCGKTRVPIKSDQKFGKLIANISEKCGKIWHLKN